MNRWHIIGAVLAVLAIIVILSQAGPPSPTTQNSSTVPVEAPGYRTALILGEGNKQVDALVTFMDANGTIRTVKGSRVHVYGSFCAEARGYLKSCSDGNVIHLIPDPELNLARITVRCDGYFFIGPPEAPVIVERHRCNTPISVPPGRYRLIVIDKNMRPVERMCVHPGPGEVLTLNAEGHSCVVLPEANTSSCEGNVTEIIPIDAETGKTAAVIYTDGKIAWRAEEQNVWSTLARWVYLWGQGYKRASVYISPSESNAAVRMLHQQGGGTLVVETNAPKIAVIDINNAVLYFGEPRTLENVPPGSYKIVAYDGAAYTEVDAAVGAGITRIAIAKPQGTGTLVAREPVAVFVPGTYSWTLIARGEGMITVPADTVLRVALPDGRVETVVVLPGEEKVI